MTLRLLTLALGCASLFALTGCPPNHDNDDAPQRPVVFNNAKKHTPPDSQTTSIPEDDGGAPEPTPAPRHTTTTVTSEAPPSSGPTAPQGDYPYGVPVSGKPGFVTSPYAPDSGYVDVHGYATGQEVRDPYTQKIFLVP